jgi:hypothetical protein
MPAKNVKKLQLTLFTTLITAAGKKKNLLTIRITGILFIPAGKVPSSDHHHRKIKRSPPAAENCTRRSG